MPSSSVSPLTAGSHLPSPPAGTALFPRVHAAELDNGLQVLVAHDTAAPVVSIQYWCATGSIHEGRWLGAGLSHLLEHLLFKGTPSRGNSGMAQEIQDLGGHLNAYTSFDRTVYHIDLPAENWEKALAILTDAVQHSLIPAEEFEPEKEVIRREFAMGDDNPDSVLTKLAFRTAFTTHPYRFPVIGHLDLFNRLTREDVVSYYRERYAPQPRRAVQRRFPTDISRLCLLHPIPGLHHADLPALQILGVILGGGRSSLLHQLLVEREGLAEEVDAFAYAPGRIGLFGVDARCSPRNLSRLTGRIREELEKFASAPPAGGALERAKRLCATQQVHQLKTMSGKAAIIGGGWQAARDPYFNQTVYHRLQQVALEEVVEVARRYLIPATENEVTLVPEGAAAEAVPCAGIAGSGIPLPEKVPALDPLRTLYLRSERLPLFTFRATLPGGLLHEPPGKAGLCRLASQLLLKGTVTRSAEQIAGQIEELGGSLASDSGNNSASLHLELLSQDWERGLDLFLDVLTASRFDEHELETEKRKHLAALALEQDQPMAQARDLVRGALYPGHPYAHGALGTAASVSALTWDDAAGFISTLFQQSRLVLGATGPIEPAQWQEIVRRRTAGFLPRRHPLQGPALPQVDLSKPIRLEKTTPKEQAVLQIAFPTVALAHPDQVPLTVLGESLSDLDTRLFVRIREQLGLAYFVSAARFVGSAAGYFVFYAGTDPKKRRDVEAAMLEEIAKLAGGGLTVPEFERARAKLLSEEKIDSQNPAGVVAGSALDELLGLGHDAGEERRRRLIALTLEEVNAAAARYFGKEEFVVAAVSPA